MCKPGKSFNTWVKVKFFVTKCNEGRKPGHGRGSAPYRHSDSISRLWAMSKSDWLKRRTSVRALSLEPLLKRTLPALETRSPTPDDGPLDSRLKTG